MSGRAAGEGFNVAVVGATGLVGETMIEVLEERKFPVKQLFALASERSLGKSVTFRDKRHSVGNLAEFDFSQVDIALFSPGGEVSREYAPKAAAAGCVVIDNTSEFRYLDDVPLVVPEVNADHLSLIETQSWRKQSGGYIVTNPNCSAIGLVLALKPLADRFGLESVFVSTMQAVSGAGYPGVAVRLVRRRARSSAGRKAAVVGTAGDRGGRARPARRRNPSGGDATLCARSAHGVQRARSATGCHRNRRVGRLRAGRTGRLRRRTPSLRTDRDFLCGKGFR